MKFKIFLFPVLLFFFTSCTTKSASKVKIPKESCLPSEIILNFEKVIDLSSSLRNQKLASIYFKKQKEEIKNSTSCYKEILEELNK